MGLPFSFGHGFCYADSESLSYPCPNPYRGELCSTGWRGGCWRKPLLSPRADSYSSHGFRSCESKSSVKRFSPARSICNHHCRSARRPPRDLRFSRAAGHPDSRPEFHALRRRADLGNVFGNLTRPQMRQTGTEPTGSHPSVTLHLGSNPSVLHMRNGHVRWLLQNRNVREL